MAPPLLLAQAAATWFLCGLAWFVQVVHYPLFARVGPGAFPAYHAGHTRRTTWVVAGPMGIELLAAVLLVPVRPPGVAPWMVWTGLALVLVIWGSTFALQVPRHADLAGGYDGRAHVRLVRSSWIRTAAWSGRTVLVTWMLAAAAPCG